MVVKQFQNRKPRGPSPTLWAIVRKISEEHWMKLRAYSQAYGKQSLQFRLLEFLRAMAHYDAKAEKEAFADCNLGSMRSTAKKWLLKSAIKLGLYLPQLESDVCEVDVLIQWECYEEAFELIDASKSIATANGEFAWLARLYEQEIAVVRAYYEGDERISEMKRLGDLVVECSRMQLLASEIKNQTIANVEAQKFRFGATGTFDVEAATAYFHSAFYEQDISHWPIIFQLEKLHIDESNYIFLQDGPQAVSVASRILEIYDANPDVRNLRRKDHAKILFRLCSNNFEIGNAQSGLKILEAFRKVNPLALENREFYLCFFLHSLFEIAYDTENLSLASEGASIWDDQRDYILTLPMDAHPLIVMLFVCSFHVAMGDMLEARAVFNALYPLSDHLKSVWYQAIYRILHTIILLEEGDYTGLESYGKSYRRHLKRLESADLGLEIVTLLAKTKHLEEAKSLKSALKAVVEMLETHQNSQETSYKPFLFPLILWAKRKIAALQ